VRISLLTFPDEKFGAEIDWMKECHAHWSKQDDSQIQIKDKQDLLHALADRDTFTKILQQADDTLKSTEYLREISSGQDVNSIVDYFMRIKDKVCLEELRFY
jgi:hypothetical protein